MLDAVRCLSRNYELVRLIEVAPLWERGWVRVPISTKTSTISCFLSFPLPDSTA